MMIRPLSKLMVRHFFIFLFSTLFLIGCRRVPDTIEPKVNSVIEEKQFKELPSPFPPLSNQESSTPWGIEYRIGLGFARKLDLYQAITAFKRSSLLIPTIETERALEIDYNILLCYYLGKKYEDVIDTFENSRLAQIDEHFPGARDLLLMLHDSQEQLGQKRQAEKTLQIIETWFPETADKVHLSEALIHANFPLLAESKEIYIRPLLETYNAQKKSTGFAQGMNALLPGAGYFYLGQKQSGMTALLLNGLFIAAAVHFYQHDHLAAGIIFTSFEAGWYFGGIYGAGLEAKHYNERLYERLATPLMHRENLFPVLMLQMGF